MSGALRAFDENSDGRLSIDEAHAALTDGGMEIPPADANLTFIWSRKKGNGHKQLQVYEVTISDMIDDVLAEL